MNNRSEGLRQQFSGKNKWRRVIDFMLETARLVSRRNRLTVNIIIFYTETDQRRSSSHRSQVCFTFSY